MSIIRSRRPSLLFEPFALAELAQLITSPIYYGDHISKGDGRSVLVIPPLFANDLYVYPMHSWLRRMGYRPIPSTLIMNAGCPQRQSQQIEEALRRRMAPQPGRIALVGHSRGGILARAIAARLQDQASHLILLGSPVGAIPQLFQFRSETNIDPPAAPIVIEASARARRFLDPDCNVPDCGCPFPEDIRRPLSPQTNVVSIYSCDDPIVPTWVCRVLGGRNVEVHGTHSGLVYNRAVYRELATALAS